MTTSIHLENVRRVLGGRADPPFDWREYVHEHVIHTPWLALWLLALTYLTARVALSHLADAPLTTALILLAWAVSLGLTAAGNILHRHTPVTFWLSRNLYSSITNALITLLLVLLLVAGARGFIGWALLRASFTTDPVAAETNLARWESPGANWGSILDNFRNLMVFRFPRQEDWRLWAMIFWLAVLLVPTPYVYGRAIFRGSWVRRLMTWLWLLTPVVSYLLLVGLEDNPVLPRLNPDTTWGGLLLTVIIAVFGIMASFPLGVLLALGRRSRIGGVPAWLTWLAAGGLTLYFLATTTLPALRGATTSGGRVVAFWPLLILLAAYLFQRVFRGNVVALLSTLYIEVIRGVPLITILFMSIILFPIFLPPGMEVRSTWRVLAAVTLFAAAYLAENIRGGLQSIPAGQYEAADALGLSTFVKYRRIILPQALRVVIPAIVGQFIGLFKDTTLVAIVGLTELLGIANLISAQPDWLGVHREPYVFIALIYFSGNFFMATYSRRLERRLGVGER